MRLAVLLLPLMLCVSSVAAARKDADAFVVDNGNIVALTKFLEEQPLHESAPALRALLLDWEDKSKDTVDVVCPAVLEPIPADGVPHGPELLAQFIFGSAAHQIAHPDDKGKLMPGQLAGMRSLLKAYAAILAQEPKAAIARFDTLAKAEADGTLEKVLEPVVQAACK
jgi:hypothetical protein